MPRVPRVVFRVLPEENARLEQLLAGIVDVMEGVPPSRADEVESSHNLNLAVVDGRQYNYIVWNTARSLFAEPGVRQALTLAIDRQALVDTLWSGRAEVAVSPLPGSVWAHNQNLEAWPYDPDRSRRLLTAAGWVDADGDGLRERNGQPFSFELSTNTGNQVRRDALVLIQEQLRQVGVDAQPTFLEIQTLIDRNEGHDFDATLGAWAIDTSLDVSFAFHSREIDGGYNYGAFSHPEADELMDRISATLNPKEAKPAFDRLQEILSEQQPYTFLWEPQGLVAIHRRIGDARPNALLTFFNLEEWRLVGAENPTS